MTEIEHNISYHAYRHDRMTAKRVTFKQEKGKVMVLRQVDLKLDRVYVSVSLRFDKGGKLVNVAIQESRGVL